MEQRRYAIGYWVLSGGEMHDRYSSFVAKRLTIFHLGMWERHSVLSNIHIGSAPFVEEKMHIGGKVRIRMTVVLLAQHMLMQLLVELSESRIVLL